MNDHDKDSANVVPLLQMFEEEGATAWWAVTDTSTYSLGCFG